MTEIKDMTLRRVNVRIVAAAFMSAISPAGAPSLPFPARRGGFYEAPDPFASPVVPNDKRQSHRKASRRLQTFADEPTLFSSLLETLVLIFRGRSFT